MKGTGIPGVPPRETEKVPTTFKQIDVPRLKKKKNKKFKQSAVQTQMNFKVLPHGQIPK